MNDIINALPPMLSGDDLISALSVLPPYSEEIRNENQATRLIELSQLYNVYVPSEMSTEIYSKLYLALLRSLQKKIGNNAIRQRNANHKAIVHQHTNNGILGGTDSFTIVGSSGIGKSSAINRAIELITATGVIEVENIYSKIIPCVVVQTPFDCSVKGLLIEILRKVDEILGYDYYQKALKGRVTTDMLIGNVSQVALNHIGLLVVDEIQNVVTNSNGRNLVGMLTQLINNSGISICMVGTPESTIFFEQAMQLARRSLGLQYTAVPYNQYFCDFCTTLFRYQYTKNKAELDEVMLRWLYEHSGGIISVVVSLLHDSQEIAILNGQEIISLETLNIAYKNRLSMLHSYIEPTITRKKQTSTKAKQMVTYAATGETQSYENIVSTIVQKSKDKGGDLIAMLKEVITVEVVKL